MGVIIYLVVLFIGFVGAILCSMILGMLGYGAKAETWFLVAMIPLTLFILSGIIGLWLMVLVL